MGPRLKTVLLLLLTFATVPALAADKDADQWYQVELVIFANHGGPADEEVWPESPEMPDLTDARELQPAGDGTEAFQTLPADDFQLKDVDERLQSKPDLEPLLHVAWRQPGLPRERAIAVHLTKAAASDDSATNPTVNAAAQPPRLDGTVRLVLSRYLHLEVDLAYRDKSDPSSEATAPESPEQDANAQSLSKIIEVPQQQVYRMIESRRMRSREIHYLDHPKFGVIALVTPYDKPAPKQSSQAKPPSDTASAAASASAGTIQR